MSLAENFEVVRPSIVALGSRISISKPGKTPPFPFLLGTGFVVDPRGIVVTNRHVADDLMQLPVHPKTGAHTAFAMLSSPAVHDDAHGQVQGLFFVDIRDYRVLDSFASTQQYYGEPVPDMAFLQIDACELPALELATRKNTWQIGMSIATAGFPLGNDALVVYGNINQITPLLRHGIISSLYPFPCSVPHGFTIDVMMQGGGSGSPIFLPDTPTVVGLLHGGFPGTNITIALPSHLVRLGLADLLQNSPFQFSKVPTYQELADDSQKNYDGLHFEQLVSE
ncbi:MAG: trypsin-like peptidase domain-containing protein [Acidobacteriota bacterium]